MVPLILNPGKTKLRSRRKLKRIVHIFYLFAAAMGFSYWKILSNVFYRESGSIDDSPHSEPPRSNPSLPQRRSKSKPKSKPKSKLKLKSKPKSTSDCAILLFGLPRAFRNYVLPSLEENVIGPNARYGCDYFVHYFQQDSEASGRSGRGGSIRSEDVFLLEASVAKIHAASIVNDHDRDRDRSRSRATNNTALPTVAFVSDTNETFWEKRGAVIQHYRTTKNPDGNYRYFPYGERTYEYPGTMDNIIRQWHSVNAVWDAMEEAGAVASSSSQRNNNNKHGNANVNVNVNVPHPKYRRVAMMRSDVIYLTPIDIYAIPSTLTPIAPNQESENKTKTETENDFATNAVAVIPNFAKYPVNDRLIYGPHASVKIWASQRFSKIEEYAKDPSATPGMIMHSETFLNASILQSIRDSDIDVNIDANVNLEAGTENVAITNANANANANANPKKISLIEDPWMCFLRVRADGAIWIQDCDPSMSGFDGGYPGGEKAYVKILRKFLPNHGKGCKRRRLIDKVRKISELACPDKNKPTTEVTKQVGRQIK